jgi:methionine synthase II (cobalamin-independent)
LIKQFEYLKTLLPEERWGDIKLTFIAPPWYHLRYKEGQAFPREVYPTDEDYFADIAVAVQTELDILYAAGLRNVQFDDPNFACTCLPIEPQQLLMPVPDFCSEKMLKGWAEDKSNLKTPDQLLDSYIQCYNDSIKNHVGKMHIGLHICRGTVICFRSL